MTELIYISNDNILELNGLKDEVAGTFINSATVTVTLVDSDGTEVVGDTWPKTMSYATSSDGIYRATLLDTLTLTEGACYTAKVIADGGAGLQAYFETPIYAALRTTT